MTQAQFIGNVNIKWQAYANSGTDKLTKNVCAMWEIDTPMDQ
jgi:hypothetical protein